MYIKDLNEHTLFVKTIDGSYYVGERDEEGVHVLLTTKDPLKATTFKIRDVYKDVYANLSKYDKERLVKAYETEDNYSSLTYLIRDTYQVLTSVAVEYGYNKDIEAEKKLLSKLDLEYIFKPKEVITKDIDEEEDN